MASFLAGLRLNRVTQIKARSLSDAKATDKSQKPHQALDIVPISILTIGEQANSTMKAAASLLFIAATAVCGFQNTPSGPARRIVAESCTLTGPKSFQLFASSPTSESETSDSATEPKAQGILDEFHASNFPFRIVVIGNGAILETTSKLGPKSKSSVSPKTGDKLLTFASEDASFEFHVKVDQITKITFVTSERPLPDGESKTMRVSRFLNEKGEPMCSLILADSSDESAQWFDGMSERYGQEVNL